MPISKVKEVTVGKPWTKDGSTFVNHSYTFDDGEKIQASHKSELPFPVGTEVEYVIKRTDDYGNKGSVKKPNSFQKGGYKKPTLSIKDINRMAKSNALNLMYEVNRAYGEERVKSSDLAKVVAFSLAGLTQDIEKFGEDDSLLTSRLSALNQAANAAYSKSLRNVDEVLELAKNHYNYIKG